MNLNRGLLLGWGLFETLLVRGGRAIFLAEHHARLSAGCERAGLPRAPSLRDFAAAAARAVTQARVGAGRVKLCWVREDADRGELFAEAANFTYAPRMREEGMALVWGRSRRDARSPLAGLKSLSYMELALEREAARAQGADDALLLDQEGFVAECAAANIFWRRGMRLYSPSLDRGILPGIVREKVLQSAPLLGYEVEVGCFLPGILESAEEIFATSSLLGIMPVARIGGQSLFPGESGFRLREVYEKLVDEDSEKENIYL